MARSITGHSISQGFPASFIVGSGDRGREPAPTGNRADTRTAATADPGTSDAGEPAPCAAHGPGYRHWHPPPVRAVQLAFYQLQALAHVGVQSRQYGLTARALTKYLRGITRRSCPRRTAAVEAQAECFAQAAHDAIAAGVPIAEVMTLIQDRRYDALYQLKVRPDQSP